MLDNFKIKNLPPERLIKGNVYSYVVPRIILLNLNAEIEFVEEKLVHCSAQLLNIVHCRARDLTMVHVANNVQIPEDHGSLSVYGILNEQDPAFDLNQIVTNLIFKINE